MNVKLGFCIVLLCALAVCACSRDAVIRNSVDAARAVCCLAHIKQGKTVETAETLCSTIEAVSPYIERTEDAAQTTVEVTKDGGND